jgi:hypothetical protein
MPSRTRRFVPLLAAAVTLAACGRHSGTHRQAAASATAATASIPTTAAAGQSGEAGKPTGTTDTGSSTAALDIARKFVAATGGYDWHASYAATFNAALAAYTTDTYRAAHTYNAAKAAHLQAGMVAGKEHRGCRVTSAVIPADAPHTAARLIVRITTSETSTATGVAANTFTDTLQYVLIHTLDGWRIDSATQGG